MELTLSPWQLVGITVGIVVGITTMTSLVYAWGIRIGRFPTRDDLNRTNDKLEKKIDDTKADLEKKIDDTKADLEKKIDDTKADLEKKIDDTNDRMEKRFDEVLLAIHNMGSRLENAIMEHTHDEDGVAVFRRHPQMDVAD